MRAAISSKIFSIMACLAMLFSNGLNAQTPELSRQASEAKSDMLAGRNSEAALIYKRMVAEYPNEAGLRFNLGLALHSAGRYREAIQILMSIRKAEANNAKYWFLLGVGQLKLHDDAGGIESLEQALSLTPQDRNTRMELASAYLDAGRWSKAEQAFGSLTEQYPDNPSFWEGLALSQLAMAKANPEKLAAAQETSQHLAATPESAEKHESMGRVLSAAGRRTEAVAEFRQARESDPASQSVKSDLARALWANRQFDEAAALFAELALLDPKRADWQFELGDCLSNMGQVEAALLHLKTAVTLDAAMLPAQAKLGELLLKTGDADGAIPHLEAAKSIDQDGSIHFQLSTAYRRQHQSKQPQ